MKIKFFFFILSLTTLATVFSFPSKIWAVCSGTYECGTTTYRCEDSGSRCSSPSVRCTDGSACVRVCDDAGRGATACSGSNASACISSPGCSSGSCVYENSCTWYSASNPTPTPGGGGGGSDPEPICALCSSLVSASFSYNGEFTNTVRASTVNQPLTVRCNFGAANLPNVDAVDQGQLINLTWGGWSGTVAQFPGYLRANATPGRYNSLCETFATGSCSVAQVCPSAWYICPISNYAPTNLSPSGNISAGTQNISWTGQTGAESYTLVITNTATNQTLVNQTTTATSYSYNFAVGTNYRIEVRANYYSTCGSSDWTITTVSVPQPTITLSGRYLVGSSQVSLRSGTSYPSLSWDYPLGSQNVTATDANGYSLSVPKPTSGSQEGTLTINIPANSPYVCSGTAYNSKSCSYRVTIYSTSTSRTQDILVIPVITLSGQVLETTTSQPANLCSLPGTSYPNISNSTVSLYSPTHSPSVLATATVNNGAYTLNNVRSDWSYDLRLSFTDPSSFYTCACPTVFGTTTTNCQYTSLNFSSVASRTRNFYLIDTRMASTAWFQIFGGNAFATGSIHSIVPTACNSATSCADALMASVSSNSLSSGFPVSQATDTNSIQTTNDALSYHSYIHQTPSDGGRADNANNNSYQVGSQVQLASYQELLAKLTVVPEERTESTLDLASWRSASFWGSEDTHFIRVTAPEVLLTDQSHFTLASGEKILVIVNGNLSIRNTGASNTKITQVPEGAFLGFIVSGNITIENSVGADISLSDPSALPATRDNAQLSGVFYANEQLIVEAYSDPPDRKLIAAGSFVGRQAVDLQRRFEADGTNNAILNSYQAVENFIFRPDFVANWPQGLRIAATNWRQINPRYVPGE